MDLLELRIIYLHNNPTLSNISSTFLEHAPHLRMFILHHTALSFVPDGLFAGQTHLKILWLYNNALQSIDSQTLFSDLREVTWVKLSGNNISSVPAGLLANSSEASLDLLDNPVHVDCCTLCGLKPDKVVAPAYAGTSSLSCGKSKALLVVIMVCSSVIVSSLLIV